MPLELAKEEVHGILTGTGQTLLQSHGIDMARLRFGTLHLTGARDFQFELFLRARANRNQSMQNLTGLCDPAALEAEKWSRQVQNEQIRAAC